MHCPQCTSKELKVLEKRDLDIEKAVRRRRECASCSFRFTTYERIEPSSLTVIKKDKTRELFSKDKLRGGIEKALEKRPISTVQVEGFIDAIERELKSRGESEIKSADIGNLVLERLKELDDVAYLRFASVYKSFKDIESFKKELEKIS